MPDFRNVYSQGESLISESHYVDLVWSETERVWVGQWLAVLFNGHHYYHNEHVGGSPDNRPCFEIRESFRQRGKARLLETIAEGERVVA